MSKIFTNVHEALASRIPETKAWIIRVWTARFEEAYKKFGPTLRSGSNVSKRDYSIAQEARSMAKVANPPKNKYDITHVNHYVIDMERVEKQAQAKAEALCLQWENKIVSKTESLTNVKLVYGGDLTYTITGERDGRKVTIEQIMTLCANFNGTVYNQFPARIYMDGKFVPEEAYKAMFGEVKEARPIASYKSKRAGRNWGFNTFVIYPVAADGKKTEGQTHYVEGYKACAAKLHELITQLSK